MKRGLLILSVVMNAVLAVAVLHRGKAPSVSVEPMSAPVPQAVVATSAEAAIEPAARDTASFVTNQFHWRNLESEDYHQYVENLRGVGCPEKTIRDIVAADVEKLYAAKSTAVPVGCSFWSSGLKRAEAKRAQEVRQRALEEEKNALLQQVLGVAACSDRDARTDDLIEQAIMRFMLGPTTEAALQGACATLKKGEKLAREIESRASGILLPADEAAVAKVHKESLAELKRWLTPEQIEEFAARVAALNLAEHGMEYFNPTPTELRQMAHLQAVILGLGDETPFEILHTRQETDAEEKEFETRLKACLGEDRFTEYRRAQDPAYQEAVDFTKQNDLPAGTAAKVYQIKQVADAGRDGLEEDQSLAGLEKERQLRQIQETTSQAIEGLLGSKAFGEYLKQGRGSWVTNYVKAQRSKSQISESRLQ